MSFGKRLINELNKLGITQAEFADKLGVSQQYVSNIKHSVGFPRELRLVKILNALPRADARYLITGKRSKK